MILLPTTATCASRALRTCGPVARIAHGLLATVLTLALCGSEALAQSYSRPPLSRRPRVAQVISPAPARPEPEAVPTPKSATQTLRFAPIGDLTLGTATSPGLLPPDLAAETLGRQPPLVLAPGMTRPWPPQVFCWYGVPLYYAPSYGYRGSPWDGLPCSGRAAETGVEVISDAAKSADDRPTEIPPPGNETRP